MMGGRVAEELVFGREKVTSGAASDIEQATRLARMMVTRWGLSEELGTVSYGENQDEVFLGMSVSRTQNASEATVQKIDSEIKRLVEQGYNEATRILTEKRADLETLAKGLLEFETLSGEEIIQLLECKPPIRGHTGAAKARKVRDHVACEQGIRGQEPVAALPRAANDL
jgi:cell division protease FtsH